MSLLLVCVSSVPLLTLNEALQVAKCQNCRLTKLLSLQLSTRFTATLALSLARASGHAKTCQSNHCVSIRIYLIWLTQAIMPLFPLLLSLGVSCI